MRQVGDLMVWVAMIATLVAVLYLTPRLARYLADETRPNPGIHAAHGLALLGPEAGPETAD